MDTWTELKDQLRHEIDQAKMGMDLNHEYRLREGVVRHRGYVNAYEKVLRIMSKLEEQQ